MIRGDIMINTIDTFKNFKEVFKDKLDISIDDKIKLWEYEYMIHYPEFSQNKRVILEELIGLNYVMKM